MKIIILTIVSIFFCSLIFAQDTIILRNGNRIRSKVLEIEANQIKYTNFNDPDGIIYYMPKSDIKLIKYQNGTKTIINPQAVSIGIEISTEPFNKPRKISIGMDSTKFFIGYDVLKGIIDENSLMFGYKFNKHQFVTASIGFTYCSKYSQGSALSPDQEKYPLFIFKGPTFRASYNYLLTRSFYIGFDACYKHLYYTSHWFQESYNDAGYNYCTYFERSEDAKVFGWHIDAGFFLNHPKSRFYINPIFGIGQTTRYRTYTTTNESQPYWVDPWLPLGTFSETLKYISYNVGFNCGIRF